MTNPFASATPKKMSSTSLPTPYEVTFSNMLEFSDDFINARIIAGHELHKDRRASLIKKIKKFKAKKTSRDCSICYDGFQTNQTLSLLPCGHYYHPICVQNWFKTQVNCPICRVDLLEYYSDSNN